MQRFIIKKMYEKRGERKGGRKRESYSAGKGVSARVEGEG
jgi:hypothetical protein